MKNFLTCSILLTAALAFGGVDDFVLTFSTKGPDTYADGTTVLDGEFYALCWTKTGSEFAGFDANGNLVDAENNKILLKAPIAKDGHCPLIQFEIDETYVANNGLKNGNYSVYLLDTRRFQSVNGVVVRDASGTALAESWGQSSGLVNGYGKVAGNVSSGSGVAAVTTQAGVTSGEKASVPTEGRNLKIRDFKLIGDNVYIYVSGTLPTVRYGIKTGSKPDGLVGEEGEVYGAGTEQDLIIVTPRTEGTQFFGVQTK